MTNRNNLIAFFADVKCCREFSKHAQCLVMSLAKDVNLSISELK